MVYILFFMSPDQKTEYLQAAEDYLKVVEERVEVNRRHLNGSLEESIRDQLPIDSHCAICSNPGQVALIKNTFRFIRDSQPLTTIGPGAVFEYRSTINGKPDQNGYYMFFHPTPEIPQLKAIPGLPNIISSQSRLGKRLMGQTSGTRICVPSVEDGQPVNWEIEICKVE